MERTIMHLDMNAFFASVEQRANPALRGKPIAVVGSSKRTVVTTASYEARSFGVKTGMNMREAKKACQSLIFVVGDNSKYVDVSGRVLSILSGFSPLVEAYSIDEAFVDLTGQKLFGSPVDLALLVKEKIRDALGLTCSIGIAPNKLLAKLASDMKKPDGLVCISQKEAPAVLEGLPVTELCGIGSSLGKSLAEMGIRTCGELGRADAGLLKRRFGIIGERLRLMGQGIDHSPVSQFGEEDDVKSVGHSMTLKKDIVGIDAMRVHMLRLSEMVSARARRYGIKGQGVALVVRYSDFHTFTRQTRLPLPSNDTTIIYDRAVSMLEKEGISRPVRLLGVSLFDVTKGHSQLDLFEVDKKRGALLSAMDGVNDRFGRFTLTWASLFGSTKGPGVISPSWRPAGAKKIEYD